ncbi:lamin tail domain-containing protein [Chitinivorax sp. PXF-14]|uniref:lamin tail domain-containing protein n=1 Tax=Chitinivorax sp. PXF-14 TaxID=3230488 RepID=UPI003465AE68
MSHKHSVLALSLALAGAASAAQAAGQLVISQVYGGGGNSGASWRNDFIELYNRSGAPVSLAGWSVQYASASGTSWALTPLAGTLQPGHYYLVQQAQGAGGSQNLPAPDASGNLALSASNGKVALVSSTTALSCGAACATAPGVVDFVGFGSANNAEGSPTPALGNTLAALRNHGGCDDSDNNTADFATGAPNPRNSASTPGTCADTGSGGTSGGAAVRIHDIQGRAHLSPYNGQAVSGVPGIVTARMNNGFFMQDDHPDDDPATSEGIFVYTGSAPTANVGDAVRVAGRVAEFRPGGSGGGNNLTTTEITAPSISVVSSGNALPAPVVIGSGGRMPPGKTIYAGASGDVETLGNLNPAQNGLDFYESLEGMRVEIDNPVASGPSNSYNELPLLPDRGNWAATRTQRGGIVIAPDDFNPERIIVKPGTVSLPRANVGDGFSQIVGVMDYSFGNFMVLATGYAGFQNNGLQAETTRRQTSNELAIASFNVENLAPSDAQSKFDRLAAQIVNHLQAPDIVGLMEIQDNSGATDDGTVAAEQTFARLIAAITAAGGPAYQHRSIDPVNDQDGGQPGGNIRQGFLFNPARVGFVDRAGGDSTTAVSVVTGSTGLQLSASPGRIAPTDGAFASSRKPLAAEFSFNGHRLFVIANHWNSKGGDQPLYGRFQPPQRSSESQRGQQATIVGNFVRRLLAADAQAKVVVLGDLNDFEFSTAVGTLKQAGLHDLVETLPAAERYTYVFEGNAQVLDHILISDALASKAEYDVVHVNSEFADQASDHEPEVARLNLPAAPVNLSGQVSWSASGLSYNRATGLYSGSVTLNARADIGAPFALALSGLPAGVTLANASTTVAGLPAIKLFTPLSTGQSLTVPLQFKNPSNVKIGYSAHVYGSNL